jgi:hypothetical protein
VGRALIGQVRRWGGAKRFARAYPHHLRPPCPGTGLFTSTWASSCSLLNTSRSSLPDLDRLSHDGRLRLVLGEEPAIHYVLFVSVTDPTREPDERLEALELRLSPEDGVGHEEAGRMAAALVTTSRFVTQFRTQANWGASGLDVLTTTVSYLVAVSAGLTIEVLKEIVERWPKRGEVPPTLSQAYASEANASQEFSRFLGRAFAEHDVVGFDVFEREREGGWLVVARSTSATYKGRISPGGRTIVAKRQPNRP